MEKRLPDKEGKEGEVEKRFFSSIRGSVGEREFVVTNAPWGEDFLALVSRKDGGKEEGRGGYREGARSRRAVR